MKNRRGIALMIASALICTIIPNKFFCSHVDAAENYKKYNKMSTIIKNKYGINEKILKVKQYEDSTVILTKGRIYFIKDGKCNKFNLDENSILSSTNIERDNNYVYLLPYKKSNEYEILKIDAKKLTSESININKYVNINNQDKLQEIVIDDDKNIWLSIYEGDKDQYKLVKTNCKDKKDTKEKYIIKKEKNINYKNSIVNIKLDGRETVYFKITETYNSQNKKYILKSISKNGLERSITLKNDIRDYAIDENGCIWTISKDRIQYLSKDGTLLKSYSGEDVKDITIDSKQNIWILDDNKIKEVYNNKLLDTYTVQKDSKEISVYKKGYIAVKNTRGFTIKVNGKDENVFTDSYIGKSAVALKDKDCDIRILSDEYDEKSDYKMNDDVVVDVALKNNKFTLNNKVNTNFASYYNSIVYNGELYLAQFNTLYKIKNNCMKEYVRFNKEEYNEFASNINFDKNENIYVVGTKNIYIIDKNKNVNKISLKSIYPDEAADENILLKDKNQDVYVITKTRNGIKLNKLEGKNFRTINYRFQNGKEPVNIFLNENDEFEFVYGNHKDGYKVYKLDENLLPQEDDRFNHEGLGLMRTYNDIKGLKKSDDGKLILWIGKNMIYTKKRSNEKFIGMFDVKSNDSINSMVKGKDGRIYIGTTNSGVICYGQKIDRNPANYKEIIPMNANNVDENKEWTIKFNKKLDESSVNEDNILVVGEDGEIQQVKLSLSKDNRSIKIVPEEKYKKEQNYYIFINKDIKSQSGKTLSKEIFGKFTVKKTLKIDDVAKFEIVAPEKMDVKNKEVMKEIVTKWKDDVEYEARVKNEMLKVGNVSVKEIKVAKDSAYILFNAEIISKINNKINKQSKNIGLNCKKVNNRWKVLK